MPNSHKTFPRPSSQHGIPHPTHEMYQTVHLPHDPWRELGEKLVHPPTLQETLLRYIEYRVRYGHRGRSQGMLMFCGPPGCGKTDTTFWLADRTARIFDTSGYALVPNLAALSDENLGRSQKLVKELFADITLSASKGLTFVLIQDAEAIFYARKNTYAKTGDPSDIARVTTELLQALDRLRYGNVIIVATLNLDDGVVDEAIKSRTDLIVKFDLPNYEQRLAILRKLLSGLLSEPGLVTLAKQTEGWNGRRLSKLEMLAYIKGSARKLEALTLEDFLRAVGQLPDSDVGSDEIKTPDMIEEDELCTTRTLSRPSLPVVGPRKSRWNWPKRLF